MAFTATHELKLSDGIFMNDAGGEACAMRRLYRAEADISTADRRVLTLTRLVEDRVI